MVKVYFETDRYAELVAVFESDKDYHACLPGLQAEAKKHNMTVTESVIDGSLRDFHDPNTQIANIWDVDDVRAIDPELSTEQAMKVLNFAEDKHDASIGINWEVLELHVDYLKSEGEL